MAFLECQYPPREFLEKSSGSVIIDSPGGFRPFKHPCRDLKSQVAWDLFRVVLRSFLTVFTLALSYIGEFRWGQWWTSPYIMELKSAEITWDLAEPRHRRPAGPTELVNAVEQNTEVVMQRSQA